MDVKPNYRVSFHGEGAMLLGINIVNGILMFFTLGMYYPWARAKKMRYIYSQTELDGSRFEFHGTGEEMFKGFIKVVGLLLLLLTLFIYGRIELGRQNAFGGLYMVLAYIGGACLLPFALHSGARYRLSRTTWRGIHFGYRGNLKELLRIYFRDLFFTILTLGFYTPFMQVNLRKYILSHSRVGSTQADFYGTGGNLFWIQLKGGLLTLLTIGIYAFRYMRHLNHFYINNIVLKQGERVIRVQSHTTGMGFFITLLKGFLITLITLGIGRSFAEIMLLKYTLGNIAIDADFNPQALQQTEEQYRDAAGEDIVDTLLDIELV